MINPTATQHIAQPTSQPWIGLCVVLITVGYFQELEKMKACFVDYSFLLLPVC